MNTLPEDIQDRIYKYKHQMQFREVVNELYCMGMCAYCFGRTCCKIDTCMHCYVYCDLCKKMHSYEYCPLEDSDTESDE